MQKTKLNFEVIMTSNVRNKKLGDEIETAGQVLQYIQKNRKK